MGRVRRSGPAATLGGSVPAGERWAFQTGLCRLVSCAQRPCVPGSGVSGEEEGRGHLGVRPELGLAGGDGFVQLHLTGPRKKQDPSRKSRLLAGEDSCRNHVSLTFVTSPCSCRVVSPLVVFHILISAKSSQTTSPILREAVRVERGPPSLILL